MANWLVIVHMHASYTLINAFIFKQLQAKHDFIEQELAKGKQRENVMEVELKGLRDEVSFVPYISAHA